MIIRKLPTPVPPPQINLPPSKSLAARWLALDFLLNNSLNFLPIENPSEDIQVFLNAKTKLIYLNQSGTAYRFLIAAAGLKQGTFVFTGKPSLFRRPIAPLLKALNQAGIKTEQGKDFLKIHGNPDLEIEKFVLDASLSSQFLSALLLLAPKLKQGTKIFLTSKLASKSFAKFTLKFLENIGYYWEEQGNAYVLTKKNPCFPQKIHIEADWSLASYFLLHSSLKKSEIFLQGLQQNSLQPDSKILKLLTTRNLEVQFVAEGLKVKNLKGLKKTSFDIDFTDIPDMAQGFAVLAAFLEGTSVLRGLETLPYKETNRLQALKTELAKTGTHTEYSDGIMKVKPSRTVVSPVFSTYEDHRMAMSLSLFVNKYQEIKIEHPEVVRKTFPNYWEEFSKLGFEVIF